MVFGFGGRPAPDTPLAATTMMPAVSPAPARTNGAQARAEAIQISGEAEAQAAKYYEVFKQNPELANFLFQRKALEGLLKENSTLILDPNTPPFNLLTQPDATKAAKP